MPRRVLLAGIVTALAVVSLLGGYYLASRGAASKPSSSGRLEHVMRVEVYVYKNGELVYHDPDDPAILNFAYIIGELLDKDNTIDVGAQGTRLSGNNGWTGFLQGLNVNSNDYGGLGGTKGAVIFGESSAFNVKDTTLSTVHAIVYIDEFSITYNDTGGIEITVGGTWVYPSSETAPVNITAVGLGTTTSTNLDGTPDADQTFLLFEDILSEPVTLNPGDVIHVRYVIHIS